MVYRFFVFLFLSCLCLTTSFAIDKFIPIGNQEFLNKTIIVNEIEEKKDIILNGDDKTLVIDGNEKNTAQTNSISDKNSNDDNFLPIRRKNQKKIQPIDANVSNENNDNVVKLKNISYAGYHQEDMLKNNLEYINKTIPNLKKDTQIKASEAHDLVVSSQQIDDNFIDNDINKLTYKLSQNFSNQKFAKAIIAKIAKVANSDDAIENKIDISKLDNIYLANNQAKQTIEPVQTVNIDAKQPEKESFPLIHNTAFAAQNDRFVVKNIDNIKQIKPTKNDNPVVVTDNNDTSQSPTLVDRISRLNQRTTKAENGLKNSITSVFRKKSIQEDEESLQIKYPQEENESTENGNNNNLYNNKPQPVQKRGKRFSQQIIPPNISQKVYNLENKHLTPTIFDNDIIQNAFTQKNSTQGVENIKSIVNKFGPNIKDENGNTILMHAVAMNNYDLIHFLVTHGANPNLTNNEGFNVIHLVTSNNDYESLYEIISYSKIDCDIMDNEGNSPLMYAVSVGDLKMLKLLHLNGCNNFNVKTQNGVALIDFARQNVDPRVVDYVVANNIDSMKKENNSINLNKKYNKNNKNGKL